MPEPTMPNDLSSSDSTRVLRTPKPRVLSVIGARPEIIQAAPVCEALAPLAEEVLVHTGQHYDEAMSESQILATRLPHPDHNLGVGSRNAKEQVDLAQLTARREVRVRLPDEITSTGGEMAYAADLGSAAERHEGSSPSPCTVAHFRCVERRRMVQLPPRLPP